LFHETLLQSIRGVMLFIVQACTNACTFRTWHYAFDVIKVRRLVTIYSLWCWIIVWAMHKMQVWSLKNVNLHQT